MLKDLWHDTKWLLSELAVFALVIAILWLVGSGMLGFFSLFGL